MIEAKITFAENLACLDEEVSNEITRTATDAFDTFQTFRLAVCKFYREFADAGKERAEENGNPDKRLTAK